MDTNTFYKYNLANTSVPAGESDACEPHASCSEEQISHATAPQMTTGEKLHKETNSESIEREWTSVELELLRQYYPTEASTIHLRIPRHTLGSCRKKASLLGIRSLSSLSWSTEEDAVLMEY